MTCTDWRDADQAEIRPLYASERGAWLAALSWDLEASWTLVEQARQSGTLPGWIARDARGRIRGWSYGALHDGRLQIGGIVADRPATTRRLLDAILASPEAAIARGLSCFVHASAPGLASALRRARFAVRSSPYLARELSGSTPATPPDGWTVRPLGESDLLAAIRLLAEVYGDRPEVRCFAPDGTRAQWLHYVVQLLRGPGCGQVLPAATLLAEATGTRQAAGLVVTTTIAPGIAHIAQLGVHPTVRRDGLGACLVREAAARAAAYGCTRVTLMVDEGNQAALALYARLEFQAVGRFLFGLRGPRRDTAAVSRAG